MDHPATFTDIGSSLACYNEQCRANINEQSPGKLNVPCEMRPNAV